MAEAIPGGRSPTSLLWQHKFRLSLADISQRIAKLESAETLTAETNATVTATAAAASSAATRANATAEELTTRLETGLASFQKMLSTMAKDVTEKFFSLEAALRSAKDENKRLHLRIGCLESKVDRYTERWGHGNCRTGCQDTEGQYKSRVERFDTGYVPSDEDEANVADDLGALDPEPEPDPDSDPDPEPVIRKYHLSSHNNNNNNNNNSSSLREIYTRRPGSHIKDTYTRERKPHDSCESGENGADNDNSQPEIIPSALLPVQNRSQNLRQPSLEDSPSLPHHLGGENHHWQDPRSRFISRGSYNTISDCNVTKQLSLQDPVLNTQTTHPMTHNSTENPSKKPTTSPPPRREGLRPRKAQPEQQKAKHSNAKGSSPNNNDTAIQRLSPVEKSKARLGTNNDKGSLSRAGIQTKRRNEAEHSSQLRSRAGEKLLLSAPLNPPKRAKTAGTLTAFARADIPLLESAPSAPSAPHDSQKRSRLLTIREQCDLAPAPIAVPSVDDKVCQTGANERYTVNQEQGQQVQDATSARSSALKRKRYILSLEEMVNVGLIRPT